MTRRALETERAFFCLPTGALRLLSSEGVMPDEEQVRLLYPELRSWRHLIGLSNQASAPLKHLELRNSGLQVRYLVVKIGL